MIQTYEFVAVFFCLMASSFFSGSEAVLLSISPDRARQLIEEGGTKGKALSFMLEHTNELLTTILVGNNIVNIMAASLNTAIVARIFQEDAISIAVGISTLLILIFGEIMPKTFARAKAEKLVVPVIRILQASYFLLYPLVKLLTFIIEKMLGGNTKINGRIVTKNDIEYMVNKAEKEKTMDSKQIDLLTSILEFPTIKVKDIMIPRKEVKYIERNSCFPEIINQIKIDTHSRYPVCDDDLDETVGFLHVKDLAFVKQAEQDEFDIDKYLKPPFFVYEHMKIQAVFDHMNRKKVHLALVKDENGLVVGIVTLEDIVEEIMGDIQDEHDDDDEEIFEQYNEDDLENGGIVVEGDMSIRELYNEFDIEIPLNDNFSTVAGFILDMLGNSFPEKGQIIVWEGYSFELSRVENQEIKEIKIKDIDGDKHIYAKTQGPINGNS